MFTFNTHGNEFVSNTIQEEVEIDEELGGEKIPEEKVYFQGTKISFSSFEFKTR
jgi:hypothetical protein